MSSPAAPAAPRPWGRIATLVLGAIALIVAQFAGVLAHVQWTGTPLSQMPEHMGDGVTIAIIIITQTPVLVGLLMLFAQRRGINPLDYLGWTVPKRSEVVFGVAAVIALIIVANAVSWLFGRGIVTDFQNDIYRTASAAGALPLFWLVFAVVVATPIGEETLFRGFLFRGWLRKPGDAWPVIVATALLFAIVHLQYDYFIMVQICVFGLVLGWMRWASGSTLLTMVLHGVINLEGMLETVVQSWLNQSL